MTASTAGGGIRSAPRPYAACGLDETLAAVLSSTTHAVDGLDHAGVLVGRPPDFASTASSDLLASRVLELHLALGEGPCLEAMSSGLPVVTDSLAHEQRWPRYTEAALAAGVQAHIAVPLAWEGRTLGALGVHWERPHVLDTHLLDLVESCGLTLGALVGLARAAQELHHALDSRQMIGQAVGVLMQRYGLTSEAAFNVLRRNSQNANTKLREVALTFLRTGELPQPARKTH